MLSPAAKHRLTAQTGQAVPLAPSAGNTHQNLWLAQFDAELSQMSHIKSRTRRIKAKQQVLARYQDWLEALIECTDWTRRQKNMFVWLLVWHLDVGDWRHGLDLARFALNAGFTAPKEFARNLAETVCEEITNGILKADVCHNHLVLLDDLAALVESQDMADQITAKLLKARALARIPLEPEKARELLLQALELDPKSGVKRHLKAVDAITQPKPEREPAINLKEFSLSANAAAKLANMTTPTFLRHAKKHPDLLQRVEIPVGNRNYYRFNPKQVRAYLRQNLVKD